MVAARPRIEVDGELVEIGPGCVVWVTWAASDAIIKAGALNIGTLGGFVDESVDWPTFLAEFKPEFHPALEDIRRAVVQGKMRFGGFSHQGSTWDGAGRVPVVGVVVDGDAKVGVMQNSMRAHGDLMAAIWNQHHIDAGEAARFSYCHFAWTDPTPPAFTKTEGP